ncbi:unnamed protein product [Calypogeia fissa]
MNRHGEGPTFKTARVGILKMLSSLTNTGIDWDFSRDWCWENFARWGGWHLNRHGDGLLSRQEFGNSSVVSLTQEWDFDPDFLHGLTRLKSVFQHLPAGSLLLIQHYNWALFWLRVLQHRFTFCQLHKGGS